jgi:hypothetical protein
MSSQPGFLAVVVCTTAASDVQTSGRQLQTTFSRTHFMSQVFARAMVWTLFFEPMTMGVEDDAAIAEETSEKVQELMHWAMYGCRHMTHGSLVSSDSE